MTSKKRQKYILWTLILLYIGGGIIGLLHAWWSSFSRWEDSIAPARFQKFLSSFFSFTDGQYGPTYYLLSSLFATPYLLLQQRFHWDNIIDRTVLLNCVKIMSWIMGGLGLRGIFRIATMVTKNRRGGIIAIVSLLGSGLFMYLATVSRVDVTAFAVGIRTMYFFMAYIDKENDADIVKGTILLNFTISAKDQWLVFFLPILLGGIIYLIRKRKRETLGIVIVTGIISAIVSNLLFINPDRFRERIQNRLFGEGIAGYKKDLASKAVLRLLKFVSIRIAAVPGFLLGIVVFLRKTYTKERIWLYMLISPAIFHLFFHLYIFGNLTHRHFLPFFLCSSVLAAWGSMVIFNWLGRQRIDRGLLIGVISSLSLVWIGFISYTLIFQTQRLGDPRIAWEKYLKIHPISFQQGIVFGDEESCLSPNLSGSFVFQKENTARMVKKMLPSISQLRPYDGIIICANIKNAGNNAFGTGYAIEAIFTGSAGGYEMDAINTIVYYKRVENLQK